MAGGAANLIVADAEFLAMLPEISPSSTIGQAIQALSAAGRLATVLDAKRHAESSYQALVNSSLYQAIPAETTSRSRRARAKTMANQAPMKLMTRHAGVTELIVVVAAIEREGCIVTSHSGHAYYCAFQPPLDVLIFTENDLPNLV